MDSTLLSLDQVIDQAEQIDAFSQTTVKEERSGRFVFDLIDKYVDTSHPTSVIFPANTEQDVNDLQTGTFRSLVHFKRINNIPFINKFFEVVNSKLPVGGIFITKVETKDLRKKRLMAKYPPVLREIYYFFDFILKRVFPKMPVTRKIYYMITKGRNRVLSKTETMGRLYSCGFKIIEERYIGNRLYIVCEKVKEPFFDEDPSYGIVFPMRRIGKNGKLINVYKFRTMHAFSEYLQEYVYEKNSLEEGGKFKDDFRVSKVGKLLRKYWLDELPMIINVLRGDLKIVGVRPLSRHYLSLYTPQLRERRLNHKPGLVPPFYVDLPKTMEEIIASENRYFDQYEKNPIWTDVKYFFLIFYTIISKKAFSN
jgi:lipopolysaccharide/colanic/teichoic acid biosynthesis glycosyltransferase